MVSSMPSITSIGRQKRLFSLGSDIGGIEKTEISPKAARRRCLRWAQLGAFNPVMENGGGGEHHLGRDEETVSIYRRFAWLHHAGPYLMESSVSRWERVPLLWSLSMTKITPSFWGRDFCLANLQRGLVHHNIAPDGLEGRWVSPFDPTKILEAGTTITWEVPLDTYLFLYERVLQ